MRSSGIIKMYSIQNKRKRKSGNKEQKEQNSRNSRFKVFASNVNCIKYK